MAATGVFPNQHIPAPSPASSTELDLAASSDHYARRQAEHHRHMLSLLASEYPSVAKSSLPVDIVPAPPPVSISPPDTTRCDTASSSISLLSDFILQSPSTNTGPQSIMSGTDDMPLYGQGVYDGKYFNQPTDDGLYAPSPIYDSSKSSSSQMTPFTVQPGTMQYPQQPGYGQLVDSGYPDVVQPSYPQIEPQQTSFHTPHPAWYSAYSNNAQPNQSYQSGFTPYHYPVSTSYGSTLGSTSSGPSPSTPYGVINTDCLGGPSQHKTGLEERAISDSDIPADYPASPLCSVSGSPSPLSTYPSVPPAQHRARRASEHLPRSETKGGKRAHKRKLTWTPGMSAEGPNVSDEQKMRELLELERLEEGGAGTRRDRRRLQNRLAQRAFRARSKVVNNEAATHLVDLEELAKIQAEKLAEMSLVMAKLRKENDALKANNLGPLA